MVAPTGVRNVAEASVDFIEDGIVMQTMGRDGLGLDAVPPVDLLLHLLLQHHGDHPDVQMPATARMAIPLFLALMVWVIFITVGIKHQGFVGYLKSSLFPPGVPMALYFLVTPIEFISTFLVRPFSLAVRLFANMLAGHILLVTFAILTDALITAERQLLLKPIFVLPLLMLIFLTAFEILVGVPAGLHLHDPRPPSTSAARSTPSTDRITRSPVQISPHPEHRRHHIQWKQLAILAQQS